MVLEIIQGAISLLSIEELQTTYFNNCSSIATCGFYQTFIMKKLHTVSDFTELPGWCAALNAGAFIYSLHACVKFANNVNTQKE